MRRVKSQFGRARRKEGLGGWWHFDWDCLAVCGPDGREIVAIEGKEVGLWYLTRTLWVEGSYR
ncbi:hypothetical protein BaRGS_00012083, partial [Batillaria attramentaria]